MGGYQIIHLSDMLEILGEEDTKSILSTFSCPLNKDIEDFLRFKAITFSAQGLAKTHLVFTSYKDKPCLIGYFTLSNKGFSVAYNERSFSKTLRKRLNKFAVYNRAFNSYTVSAPLIAQLSKNFTNGYNKLISGDELLKMACDQVASIQALVGGRFVYLECEDKDFLINFYSENGFYNFGKRQLDSDEKDSLSGDYLIQMLKYL